MTQNTINLTTWDSIELDLFERMRAIKVTGDYNYTMQEVVGFAGDGFHFSKQFPVVGVVIGPEDCDDTSGVMMRRCTRQVGIEMWVNISRTKQKDIPWASRAYQMMIADIEKTLYTEHSSGNPGHTRQGYAEDTEIVARQPLSSGENIEVGAFVTCQIIYRHAIGDLYTKH